MRRTGLTSRGLPAVVGALVAIVGVLVATFVVSMTALATRVEDVRPDSGVARQQGRSTTLSGLSVGFVGVGRAGDLPRPMVDPASVLARTRSADDAGGRAAASASVVVAPRTTSDEATSTATEAETSTTTMQPAATSGLPTTSLVPNVVAASQAPTTQVPTDIERISLGSGNAVTLAFGGDMHFEGFLAGRLRSEPLTMLDPIAEMMADADLAIANLETAVTDRGTPQPKGFLFRTKPGAFDAIADAGIDVVSGANNHGMDFGEVGLFDTIEAARAKQFPLVGLGANATEAYAPWITEIKGQRIGVIGATQVLDTNLISSWTATDDQAGLASAKEVDRLLAEVAATRQLVDTLVVYLHWGVEGERCPVPRQQTLSDRLVAAGADIIVGGHAHRVQGGGRKGGAVVHYGLGNFVFYSSSGPSLTSGVLTVTATGRRIDDYQWTPARLRNGVATALTGEAAETAQQSWQNLRSCTDLR